MMHQDLGFLLNHIVEAAPGAEHAILVTDDGLLKAHSQQLGRDEADRTAAILASLQSVVGNLAAFAPGTSTHWSMNLCEFGDGLVVLVGAGSGSYIGVSAHPGADLADLVHRLRSLEAKLAPHLASPARSASAQPAAG